MRICRYTYIHIIYYLAENFGTTRIVSLDFHLFNVKRRNSPNGLHQANKLRRLSVEFVVFNLRHPDIGVDSQQFKWERRDRILAKYRI